MKFSIEWHDRLKSTNIYFKNLITQDSDIESGRIIAAREQTAGRGRSNRQWFSPPNSSLYFSLYIKTSAKPMDVPSLTMAMALAVTESLNSLCISASPKWPNDVLVDNRKICGILSERIDLQGITGVIIGIGLNINMTPEEALAIDRPATSVSIESGTTHEPAHMLTHILPSLECWIKKWENGGFSAISSSWTEKAGPIGKPLCVHDGEIKKKGTLAGFGNHGELLLQTEAGIETIWSGDVS